MIRLWQYPFCLSIKLLGMTKLDTSCGIDVSKAYFDLCLLAEGKEQLRRFSNDPKGIQAAARWLPSGTRCVMEATGPYYLPLALHLHGGGWVVSVVNPLVIRRFSQMRLLRAKTDRTDARLLAAYAREQAPEAWTPPAPYLVTLQQLEALSEQLQKQHTALVNQLEAFSHTTLLARDVRGLLQRMIRSVEKSQQQVEHQTQALIRRYHKELLESLVSIPGLGAKTAAVLIVLTGGFTRFAHYKQLAAYVGLSPRLYESGSSVRGRARICKMGMGRIRALLYLCAWSACRCNRACRELYERLLGRGKAKKVALIAVAHKLLKQAFAIATSGVHYSIDHQKKICL